MSLKIKFFLFIVGATVVPTLIVGLLPLDVLSGRLHEANLSSDLIDSITSQMRDTILAYALFLAVAFSFFSFLLYRTFGEPIADLIEGMRQIRKRNFSERVPVTSSGEIGELSETFNEMAGQIQSYIAQLEENDRAKDEFLAILSHELRNPMAPIATSIDIMHLESEKTNNPENKQLLETATRQIEILGRLLDDLLNVSRLTRGALTVNKAHIDLRNIVTDVVDATKDLVKDSSTKLTVWTPNEPIVVDGDSVRLHQALYNLIKNATEYSGKEGTIRVEVTADTEARVTVRDEGTGISSDMLPKLFNLFSRASNTHRPRGLGVGLYLVKKIMNLHGGSVSAISEGIGKGAEFEITLPLASSSK